MNDVDIKRKIENALHAFSGRDLVDCALNLFGSIGYKSEKRPAQPSYTPSEFLDTYNREGKLNPGKALLSQWESIHFLFQLTSDEIRAGSQLVMDFGGNNKVDNTIMESYLFFAVELCGGYYTRTQLAGVTREINKLFPQPAMILFRHGDTLTFSIINRRLNKLDEQKDVLEKVTLIKDINFASPHRAHIEILFDLSLDELYRGYGFANFVELHRAWGKVLDTSELNKKFFKEIANWYFWAVRNVSFPKDAGQDEKVRNATSVIRLITRLIFIWFIKEKGLVPDDLFDQRRLKGILKYVDPEESTYYKAILQNLFFATLNQEMNASGNSDNRKFRSRSKQLGGRDPHYNITNLYRYEDYFQNPSQAITLFSSIPFLNGGLFECLDKPDKSDPSRVVRIDGFSDRVDNELVCPDFLFFSDECEVDLNDAYGTTNKRYTVRGLVDTLNRYKFTINENTPIEQEVALDPELLGRVFENLLASYNPETSATARKMTGSYYTPREIVSYMVDAALTAYLESRLKETIPSLGNMDFLTEFLRDVFAYTEKAHPFNEQEISALIDAIDNVKVLDPACGSGAFPMGVLHKLVFILNKLDPDNERWKMRQLAKAAEIPDITVREKVTADIEEAFGRNELDYGRKLFLIENCIFGVDIQPIAIQISKLRFFISLVVDQKIDDMRQNRGIIPLPNLETKFVAANTLIGLDRRQQGILRTPAIVEKEKELDKVRKRHFAARTQKTKQACRDDDARLRAEISDLLKREGFPGEVTERLARWDPYDQNASSDFFDPEWMFGVIEGFDVVIANPPYLEARSPSFSDGMKVSLQLAVSSRWGHDASLITRGSDLLVYFFETSLFLLKHDGSVVFICQNSWLNTEYGRKFQTFLLRHTQVAAVVDSDFKHFDSTDGPNVNTVVSIFHGKAPAGDGVLVFDRCHRAFEEISAMSSSNAIECGALERAIYKNSDRLLSEFKWGMLLDFVNPVLQELLKTMARMGRSVDDKRSPQLSAGQGLNLSVDCVVSGEAAETLPIAQEALVPFFTSRDGAPFNLTETRCFIIDGGKLSRNECKVLGANRIKVFDPLATRKIAPVLIMPRGIGRHFCAINSVGAFSDSCVELYGSGFSRKVILNLWIFLNSSVAWLMREVSGRKNLGGGMLKAEAVDLKYFPVYFEFPDDGRAEAIFQNIKDRQAMACLEEIDSAEHQEIDEIVFACLGLDLTRRKIVVDALKSKISERQKKSKT